MPVAQNIKARAGGYRRSRRSYRRMPSPAHRMYRAMSYAAINAVSMLHAWPRMRAARAAQLLSRLRPRSEVAARNTHLL